MDFVGDELGDVDDIGAGKHGLRVCDDADGGGD